MTTLKQRYKLNSGGSSMVEIMESARASTSPKRICVVKHGISRHIPAGCGYDIRLRIHVEEWRIVILDSVIKAKSSLVMCFDLGHHVVHKCIPACRAILTTTPNLDVPQLPEITIEGQCCTMESIV